jgi:hypothetical protein
VTQATTETRPFIPEASVKGKVQVLLKADLTKPNSEFTDEGLQ